MTDPAPDPMTEGGILATARETLRPAFRPRWWEFALTFGVIALAYPFVTRLFWLGRGMAFATVSGYAVLWGLPSAIVALTLLWKSSDPRAMAAARAVLQVAIVIAMLVPLNIAGGMASRASFRQTEQNALVIIREAASYRAKHGRLPASLTELELSVDRELPVPTYGGEFGYRLAGEGFLLTLRVPGQPEIALYDSRLADAAAERGGAAPPGADVEGSGPDGATD